MNSGGIRTLTTCPEALIRTWEGEAEGTVYTLDLQSHHAFEIRSTKADTGEGETKSGEWHTWRDQLWLTFPEDEGFAQWQFEQPKPDELRVKPSRGGTITFRAK